MGMSVRNLRQVQAVNSSQTGENSLGWNLLELNRRINRLAYAASLQEVVNQGLDLLIEITAADSATYFWLDAAANQMVVEAVRNDEDSLHLVGLRLPVQEAVLQAVLNEKQPIMIGDLVGDPRWLRIASPTSAARMVNMVSLPLVTQERLLGVIQVYNYKQADLDQLELTRDRLAVEIDRRMLLDSRLHANERLHTLVDAIGQIGGRLDRKVILETVLEQSAMLVNAERASIFLVDPGTDEIAFQIAYQSPQEPGKAVVKVPPVDRDHKASERDNAKFQLFTRSAITVPIRTMPTDGVQGENLRSMGGLMALNPLKDGFSEEDYEILDALALQASNLLEAAEIFESVEELFLDIIKALVTAIDAKDPYTQGHSHRVSEYSVLIAQELGLTPVEINNIRVGSLLHDVGKIGMPDSILLKKGKLTEEEWEVIQNHPLTGWNILRQVRLLEPMLPAILEHHEKLDGSGYPDNLKGEQISLMGRIVAVADVFDAMTSDRPYRNALSVSEVMEYLSANAGILFDQRCVESLERIVRRSAYEDS